MTADQDYRAKVNARLDALEVVAHPAIDLSELIETAAIAVQLKRIADALSGDNAYALNELMENAGQAFALGMRGR